MGRKHRNPPPKQHAAKGAAARMEPRQDVVQDDAPADAVQAEAVQTEAVQAEAVQAEAVQSEAAQPIADAADGERGDDRTHGKATHREPRAPPTAATDPFALLLDYEARSLAHVVGLPEQIDAPGLWRGVGYRVGARRLASGFDEVVEILPMPQVTPVPGAQPWMLGVANVRGNLLPIVDLKQFLEGERTVLHEGQRVLVVRQPGGDVAVLVDELFGQRSFVEEQLLALDQAQARPEQPLADGRYAHFIDRAYRVDAGTWGVFSLDRLARTPEFRQAAA